MCSAPLINTTLTLSVTVKCDTPHICFTRTDNKWDRKTHLATRDFYNSIIRICILSLHQFLALWIYLHVQCRCGFWKYWFNDCPWQSVDLGNNFVYQTPLCQFRCLSVEGQGWDPTPGVVTGHGQLPPGPISDHQLCGSLESLLKSCLVLTRIPRKI